MTWLTTWPHLGIPRYAIHATERQAQAHVVELLASRRALVATEFWSEGWTEMLEETDADGSEACEEPAGRPARVEVDPSYADGITGRTGTIQGDAA